MLKALKKIQREWKTYTLIFCGFVAGFFLIRGWRSQSNAPLSCRAAFGQLAQHNGYIQINMLSAHAQEEYFNTEMFLYYASHESPPTSLGLVLGRGGDYAPTILNTQLVPWSRGSAFSKPIPLGIPTPGVSPKLFPFDSPTFDFSLDFEPARQPKVVIVRNFTSNFIPICSTFSSNWDGKNNLRVKIDFRRNPFVQASVVILGLAALGFGLLIGTIRKTENLITATASYFFSLWSIRGIVTPSGLPYPTYLDLWLMTVSIIVLFVVAWRLTRSAS